MGDVGSVVSVDSRVSSSNNRQAINPHDDDIILEAGEENNNNTTPTRSKKKKLVPYTSSKSSSSSTSMTTQETTANHNRSNTSSTSAAVTTRCYLVQGTQTQGSLIEHYSETPVQAYLAYWQPPHDKTIPKFKFTQNWGKSELINATHGDTRGKRAYYSGICQWIRSAKTFNATLSFCNQVPGWECDLYFYFSSLLLQKQTILLRDGETFTKLSMADGVAIVPRGSDFLHYDPRFQCTIDKWLAEGSKLGFASKLDVRAGSAYPKQTSHRAVGDAARPSGGASYNAKARDYARGKEKLEQNKVLADEQRAKEGYEREEAEREATKMASEQASREMRGLEEKERARVEAERLARLEIASGKKVLGDGKERGNNTMHAEENGIGNEFTLKSDQLLDDDDHDHVRDLKQSDRTVGKKTATTAHATSKTTRSNRKIFDSLHTSSEVEDSRMTTGARVYIRDTHYSWIPATIESEEDDKKRVKVRVSLPNDWEDCTVIPKGGGAGNLRMERIVKLSDYSNSELPLQNLEKDGVTWMGKNDMADLPNLHEAAILYNLKVRHSDGVPYTRVGDIMVAMNPFQVRNRITNSSVVIFDFVAFITQFSLLLSL